MSCKNKLSNLPTISNIDNQFKKLSPSSLEGLSPKQKAQRIAEGFGSMVGDIAKQVGNQIGNFTGQMTGKFSELGTLLGGLGTNLKAGIPEDLGKISPGVASALNTAKTAISKQYSNIKGLLSCEEDTSSEALRDTQEAAKLKSSVMSTSVNNTRSLSNKEIKSISEDENAKLQKTEEITKATVSEGISKTSNARSNKEIVTSQTQSLSALQVVSNNKDRFLTDIDQSILTVYETQKVTVKTDQANLTKPPPSLEQIDFLNANSNIDIAYNRIISDFNKLKTLYNQQQIDIPTSNSNLKLLINGFQNINNGIVYLKTSDKISYRRNLKYTQDQLITIINQMNANKEQIVVSYFKTNIVLV